MQRPLFVLVILVIVVISTITIDLILISFGDYSPPVKQQAAVATVAAPVEPSRAFSHIGTLVFYPNNVGPVPYLFYTDDRGGLVSKALIFPSINTNTLASWSGARVLVTGTVADEHVVVSSIDYLSGP